MNENQDTPSIIKDGNFEVAPIESITRAEVDVQISTAHQYPRSLAQFYKRAEAMVTFDEETAASCLYRLTRFDKRKNETKVIEGESVRLAEIVASCYGNLRSAVQIIGHTPTRVSVRAVCHDLETNNLIAVEKQAKTAYSDGNPYNEDMSIMIANALVSKALRDAIFRVVPKALIKPLKEKAKLIAVGTAATIKARIEKAMSWIDSIKIDRARVFAVLEVKGVEDIGIDQLEVLTGLRTSIKEGDQTADDAFPVLESSSKPLFEHPEKKKADDARKAAEAATAATVAGAAAAILGASPKPAAPTEPPPPVLKPVEVIEVKKAATPTPMPTPPPPVTREADEKELADAGLAPIVVKDTELVLMPPPEKPVAPVIVEARDADGLTEMQAAAKAVIEGAGYTLAELVAWGTGSVFKVNDIPKTWADVSEKTATYTATKGKGIIAGLFTKRNKK